MLNNPLSLTDPSGFLFKGIGKFFKKYGRTIAAIGVTLIPGINVIAAGFLAGYISTGTLKGALIGAFSAGIGDKISAIQGIDKFGRAFLQGGLGGVSSVLSGGDFGHAFLAAGLSAGVAGSRFSQGLKHTYSRSILSAVVGGTASEISGGKFANGAVTGAMHAMLAELAQKIPALPSADGGSVVITVTDNAAIENITEARQLVEWLYTNGDLEGLGFEFISKIDGGFSSSDFNVAFSGAEKSFRWQTIRGEADIYTGKGITIFRSGAETLLDAVQVVAHEIMHFQPDYRSQWIASESLPQAQKIFAQDSIHKSFFELEHKVRAIARNRMNDWAKLKGGGQ